MAIAFDSQSTVNSVTATSLTFAFNNVAGDGMVVFGHDSNGGSSLVTGVTYNSAALTAASSAVQTPGDRWISSWARASIATGSNNVVVSASSSTPLRFSAYSYSGTNQTTLVDGSNTNTGSAATSISTTITTTVDNCWMLMFTKDNTGGKTVTSSTGDTVRMTTDAGGHSVSDTAAAITPAGSNTNTHTWTGATNVAAIGVAIRPSTGAVVTTPRQRHTMLLMGVG